MNQQNRRLSKMPEEVRAEISPWFIEKKAIQEEIPEKINKLDTKAKYINNNLKVQLYIERITRFNPNIYNLINLVSFFSSLIIYQKCVRWLFTSFCKFLCKQGLGIVQGCVAFPPRNNLGYKCNQILFLSLKIITMQFFLDLNNIVLTINLLIS